MTSSKFLPALGVMDLLADVHGTAVQRVMGPFVQSVLLYGLKTLFGMERMHALPAVLFSDEALMRLVGFNAQQVRQGVCQRGAATRQGPRTTGPICPDTLAEHLVQLHRRDREGLCNGAMRALAQASVFGAKVTGMVDATDLETTARYEGCGHVTRKRKIQDTRGKMPEIAVTVYGWKVSVLIDARTQIPLAVKVVPIHAHAVLSWRALVTPARANLAGHARLHTVVFDKGFLAGTALWWLDQQGLLFVVPAQDDMAVTADARAQAAAGEEITLGRRVHTVRHGYGKAAWSERLETEVVGMTGLTSYDHYGTSELGRQQNRRDFQPNPIHAVVVRK